MNKLSKLTALLLAIVLALGVPLGALAESTDTTVQDTIDTLTEYLQVADTALYDAIMGFESYGDYWEIGELLTDEVVLAYIANNDEERVTNIQNHLDELFWAAGTSYPGNAGPLLPAVDTSVEVASAFSLISRDGTTDDTATTEDTATSTGFEDHAGLELEKSAVDNGDGTYTISLEAYAEGSVESTTKGVPVDIVLVLDVSNSMNDGFGDDGGTRFTALQDAVESFVNTIAAKYSDNTNHRICIVTFSDTKQQDSGWYYVDAAGASYLKSFVTTRDQGTDQSVGMERAKYYLIGDGYGNPSPTPRQKAVILFTDGEPNDVSAVVKSITYAAEMKAAGVTAYSVAISNNANPSTTVGGTVTTGTSGVINYLMQAVSSNFPGATASTVTSSGSGNGHNQNRNQAQIVFGDLAANVDPFNNGDSYYLTAKDPDDLNSKFENIASQINTGSSDVTLDSTTVLKDVVTPYFDLPADASSIKVYTVDCVGFNTDGTPIWDTTDGVENKVAYSATVKFGTTDSAGNTTSITDAPTETSNTVWVENFDYSANYVANVDHDDPLDRKDPVDSGTDFYGRKLVIEFDVTPTDGFLGGNDVVTNEVTSGIYEKTEDGYDPFEDFEVPDVDVELWEIQVIGKHQHIFLSNEADLNALLQSFSLTYTRKTTAEEGEEGEEGEEEEPESYTVDGILNNYAKLVFTLETKDKKQMVYTIEPGAKVGTWTYVDATNGDPIENFDVTPFLTADTTEYTISYDVIPKTTGTVKATDGELTVGVHVYKPTFTFQDTTEKYLSEVTAENYYNNNNYATTAEENQNGIYREAWSHIYYDALKVTIYVADDGTMSYKAIAVDENGEPVLVNDAEVVLGEDAAWNLGETINFKGYGSTANESYKVAMTGTKPTVAFTYSPLEETWIQGGKVTAVECVPVDVTKVTLTSTNTHDKVEQGEGGVVTEGEYKTQSVYTEGSDSASVTITKLEEGATSTTKTVTDIPHIKTLRNELDCNCSYDAQEGGVTDIHANAPETGAVPEFVIHITDVSGDLIIEKTGLKTGESAIFTATITPPANSGEAVKEYTVVLTGTSADGETTVSVTLADLLANSTYSVVESGDWSWRYTQTNSSGTSGSIVAAGEVKASFTNSRGDQWLSDESYVENDFSQPTTTN